MSSVTKQQLCELFAQVARHQITSEALQELLENGTQLGFRRMYKDVLTAARSAARDIRDSYARAKALAAIAGASREAQDFEAARNTARDISDSYWSAKALAKIAGVLAQAQD